MSLSGKGEVVLIIDDAECIRDSCCQVLTKAGYQVETAIDGETGLSRAREVGPDVILVDLDMPGVSGLEVMDRLNEISPAIVKIVVTGNTSIDLEEEVIRKGRALSYLAKPFAPDQLKQTVRRALDNGENFEQKEGFHGS
ncbi:MAG TPA: response regulator [Desulfobacterales bacterium]|nr:response regulator [Desulfobacterales bacterium]